MNSNVQCANVQPPMCAQSHITPETRTTERTKESATGLKALADAVLSRTTPRTLPAHSEQSARTLPPQNDALMCAYDLDPEAEHMARENADRWQWDNDELGLLLDVLRRLPPEIQIQNVHAITDPFKDLEPNDLMRHAQAERKPI